MKIRAQVYPIVKGEVAFGFSFSVGTRESVIRSIFRFHITFLKWHFTFDIYRG